jgi:hypothetical protein
MEKKTFAIGDEVQILPNAVYTSGNKVPTDVINTKLFIRDIKNGNYVIARMMKKGPALGTIAGDYLKIFTDENEAVIDTYVVQVLSDNFPLYQSHSKNSGIVKRLNRGLVTIVNEKYGFGKVKIGAGWIELAKVKKLQ